MARRLRRLKEFEVAVSIKDEEFIRPPRDYQRNWLLNRALKEFSDDLMELDRIAGRFVAGASTPKTFQDQKGPTGSDIMEDWQIPLMNAMVKVATSGGGDLLEIGFGRGVASDMIQRAGVRSHTVIECDPKLVEECHQWREGYPQSDIKILAGRWQDCIEGDYDSVFFHTYPMNLEEHVQWVVEDVTYGQHFFATAATHLRPSGVFTYMTNEIDSLSRSHQRRLLDHFRSFNVSLVPLQIPDDARDSWWADSMVVVGAVK